MTKITLYSTPTCVYCKMTRQFFDDNKITYADIDVASDDKAAEAMIEKSGQMGVPVIVIEKDGKEDVVVGFDKPHLQKILSA